MQTIYLVWKVMHMNMDRISFNAVNREPDCFLIPAPQEIEICKT